MIATKTIGLYAWAAAIYEAIHNGGAIGAFITGAVGVVFVVIAEHVPARRWLLTQAGRLRRMIT